MDGAASPQVGPHARGLAGASPSRGRGVKEALTRFSHQWLNHPLPPPDGERGKGRISARCQNGRLGGGVGPAWQSHLHPTARQSPRNPHFLPALREIRGIPFALPLSAIPMLRWNDIGPPARMAQPA